MNMQDSLLIFGVFVTQVVWLSISAIVCYKLGGYDIPYAYWRFRIRGFVWQILWLFALSIVNPFVLVLTWIVYKKVV